MMLYLYTLYKIFIFHDNNAVGKLLPQTEGQTMAMTKNVTSA